MVLDKLQDGLRKSLAKLTGATYVDEKLINELVKDLQRALLQSDVNVKLVFSLSNQIKERAKQPAPAGLTKREQIINILYEELARFLGGESSKTIIEKQPYIIMLVGLFGQGKTTTTGKLARYWKVRGKKVAIISTDTWRPAAYEQLRQLGEKVGVDVYGDPNAALPQEIYTFYKDKLHEYDVVIVDTAGRDALSDELVAEIEAIDKAVDADEKLLVMAAELGQSAQKQAEMFHDSVGVTGVVITRLDGTARGGGALSACATTGAPVKYVGVGEGVEDLEEFRPKNFVGRILGMGDLEALLEKASEAISAEDAQDLSERMLKGDFTLQDMYDQMQAVSKMGPLSKVLDMVPGMSKAAIPKEMLSAQQDSMQKWKFVMDSMTQDEMQKPELIGKQRVKRISSGSGQPETEVRALLKQYRKSKKLMKMMKGKNSDKQMKKLMKKMGGSGGMPNMKF